MSKNLSGGSGVDAPAPPAVADEKPARAAPAAAAMRRVNSRREHVLAVDFEVDMRLLQMVLW